MLIVVLSNPVYGYSRTIAMAIGQAARARGGVELRLAQPALLGDPVIRRWRIAAVAGYLTEHSCRIAADLGLPCVTYCTVASDAVVQVTVDHEAVGASQARHLIDRGYVHLAYIESRTAFASLRSQACLAEARRAGRGCSAFQVPEKVVRTCEWERWAQRHLMPWLKSLPKPVGIGCPTDGLALRLRQMCARCDFRTPEDVGIIGVDDDEMTCLFADPPLSSIPQPVDALGATVLDVACRLAGGESFADRAVRLPPRPVAERESTALRAVDDELVCQAIAFMEARLHEPVGVADILEPLGISRSRFEKRFTAAVGRTPYQELLRQRIARAQRLLLGTRWSIADVARQCGFTSGNRFGAAFRQRTGVSPSQYRRSMQAPPPA